MLVIARVGRRLVKFTLTGPFAGLVVDIDIAGSARDPEFKPGLSRRYVCKQPDLACGRGARQLAALAVIVKPSVVFIRALINFRVRVRVRVRVRIRIFRWFLAAALKTVVEYGIGSGRLLSSTAGRVAIVAGIADQPFAEFRVIPVANRIKPGRISAVVISLPGYGYHAVDIVFMPLEHEPDGQIAPLVNARLIRAVVVVENGCQAVFVGIARFLNSSAVNQVAE